MSYLLFATLLIVGMIGTYGTVMAISNHYGMDHDMEDECDEHMEHGGENMGYGNATHNSEDGINFAMNHGGKF